MFLLIVTQCNSSSNKHIFAMDLISSLVDVLTLTYLNIQSFPACMSITLVKGHLDFSLLYCETITRSPTFFFWKDVDFDLLFNIGRYS